MLPSFDELTSSLPCIDVPLKGEQCVQPCVVPVVHGPESDVHEKGRTNLCPSSNSFVCQWRNCTNSFGTVTGLATHSLEHIFDLFSNARETRDLVCKWNGCIFRCVDLTQFLNHFQMHVGPLVLTRPQRRFFANEKSEKGKETAKYHCSICNKFFSGSSNKRVITLDICHSTDMY